MIRAAEKMVARGKLEAAIKQYRTVLRATPDDTGTLNRVGDLYARLNRLDEAVEIFTQAADHFTQEGFLVKAIAIFKKIIRLDPTRIAVYETLADLYHRQGLRNEARSQYQVVADYFLQADDTGKVRSIYERMVELEPNNPSHRVKLAELYCDGDMIPEAMDQYQLIASFMLEHGRVDEALKVYRGAFDLNSSDLGFLTDVVLHLVDNGQPEAADQLLTEAIQRDPDATRVREVTGLVIREDEKVAPEVPQPAAAVEGVDIDAGAPAEEVQVAGTAVEEKPVEEPAASLPELEGAEDIPEGEEAEAKVETGGEPEAESVDEVVVLDLESGTTDLPFAVDTRTAASELVHDEPTAELEIDLGLIEEAEEEAEAVAEVEETVEVAEAEEVEATLEAEEAVEVEAVEEAEEEAEAVAEVEEAVEVAEAEEIEAALEAEEAVEIEAVEEAEEEAEAVAEVEEAVEVEEALEEVAALEPAAIAGELLSEAKVLASYGLDGKAAELYEQVLETDASAVEAYGLLVDLLRESDQPEAAAEWATRARSAIGEKEPLWIELRERLLEGGYRLGADGVEAPAAPEEVVPELIEVEPSLVEQGSPLWLDEDSSTEQSFAEDEEIFGSEDEFFDLAAELEQELRSEEEEVSGEFLPQLQEQSLEEIVEGFKRGVAETLSEEDYETHYNLGIAYREMGLLDEAIGEFQLAAKAPGYLVDCCSLLGACFLDKGFPDLAIKWYERGLEAPEVTENESLGLLYELGNLYLVTGDKDVARTTFAEIYGVNSNYRDVVAKLEELKTT